MLGNISNRLNGIIFEKKMLTIGCATYQDFLRSGFF
jgi:hypothetical protein